MDAEDQHARFGLEVAGGERIAVWLSEPDPERRSELSILYLHGFGAGQEGEKASFFRRRALRRGIGFCSFDFRGHGRSEGGMESLTLSRNLEDTARVRRELERRGWRRIVLLGSSMGALTALWHAALDPEPPAAALLVAPALGMGERLRRWLGAEGMERWRREGAVRIENELGSWDLGWSFIEDLGRHDERRLGARLRVPVLMLQGLQDDRVDWRRVVELAGALRARRAELHLFADGDHRLVDRKERLWRLMLEFLSALGDGAPGSGGGAT